MRSMGVLKQDDTPWPPYRTPQAHNSEYNDPSRALLTRIFHGVIWHCLYRSAIYQDVNEHTLSLLIYLLDQAWICYSSSSTVVQNAVSSDMQQPMDIDHSAKTSECSEHEYYGDKMCRKRSIKIKSSSDDKNDTETNEDLSHEILNNWFDNDDLIQNLCTTIINVELSLPLFHYYFGTTSDETNSSTVTTNLFDYFTSSVATGLTQSTTVSPNDIGNFLQI